MASWSQVKVRIHKGRQVTVQIIQTGFRYSDDKEHVDLASILSKVSSMLKNVRIIHFIYIFCLR